MKHSARLFPTVLCLLTFALTASPQSNETKKAPPGKNAPADNNAAAIALKERRAQARSLLISLASDARNFRDQSLRARSLARIADALWEIDGEQGRTLFTKAWEAAEAGDLESDQKLQEEIRQQKAKTGGGFAITLPPNLRREVLRLAARRDRALGEEFLDKLKAQKEEAADATARTRLNSSNLSEALSQRLGLAQELLDAGDIDRALQFADAALSVVSMGTIDFLSNLRDKNPTAADTRFAAMLTSAAGNMQADANTVSLLSSYIFTPHLYVMFSRSGVSSSQMSSTITPANVAPELRSAFLQAAAGILLRPQPPPEQDQSTAGIEGRYLVIKRLLPLFEQFAPEDMAEALRGQLDALNATVSDSARQRDDEWVRRGVKPEKPVEEQEQSILDRIEHAKTSAERDELYFQLAFMALGRGDPRARDFIDKIEDSELRKQARPFFDAALAIGAVEKKQAEPALQLAQTGELTHIQRAWVLAASAKLLAKTDREKCLSLIEDAGSEARRIEGSDSDRPRALLAVANVLLIVDPGRAWDATFEAVKAANSAEGFTGEDGALTLKFQSKGHSSVSSHDVPDFNLAGIFRKLADVDYYRAVELARGFQGEAPRAGAVIAIACAVLDQKNGPVLPQPASKN